MFALDFNSEMMEALKNEQLPITSIDDLTGLDTTSVAVFSDYGPDDTPFQTFGFYVTDWNLIGELTGILDTIKRKHGAGGRTIDYKGRKDEPKRSAFREWLKAVRSWPGLLYIVAIDRRLERFANKQSKLTGLEEEFRRVGLTAGAKIYSRMFGALTFMPLLSPYIKPKHKLAWITDRDCIVDTRARQDTLVRSFGKLAEEMMNKPLSDIAVITPSDDATPGAKEFYQHLRELLSVADVAASALAASLIIDGDNQFKLSCADPEAIDMVQEVSKFQDVATYKVEDLLSCPLGASIFSLEYTGDGEPAIRHQTLTLAYSSNIDPLRGVSWASEGPDIHLEVFRPGSRGALKAVEAFRRSSYKQ